MNRSGFLAVACVLIGFGSTLSATPVLAGYSLTSANSQKCLADPRGNLNPDVALIQANCNGNPNQSWDIDPSGVVKNDKSILCMAVRGSSTAVGAVIVQAACTGADAQLWDLDPIGDVTYALISRQSGLCLSVANGSRKHKAGIVQSPCDGSANQMWVAARSAHSGAAAAAAPARENELDRARRLLVGAWQSEGDPLSVERYAADGTYVSVYGKSVAGSGSYQLPGACGAGLTLTIQLANESTPFCYSVAAVDETGLTLIYLARGNTLQFKRYQP